MMLSVPSRAAWAVRATGASANCAPRAAKATASSRARATGQVLMSTTVWPARTSEASPPAPRHTARTCGSPGRHRKMISARATRSAVDGAAVTPSRPSASSGAGRVSWATTASPDFFARLRHIASPITPSPMKPSVVAMAPPLSE